MCNIPFYFLFYNLNIQPLEIRGMRAFKMEDLSVLTVFTTFLKVVHHLDFHKNIHYKNIQLLTGAPGGRHIKSLH